VRPGANAVVGYVWDTALEPVRLEVAFIDGGSLGDPEAGELTVSDVTMTPDDDGTAILSGTVASTFETEQSFVQVVLVWRDAANVVVYATSTYVDDIPAGGSAPFEEELYGENLPTTAPTETYWSI
jgi:hypothetical protein